MNWPLFTNPLLLGGLAALAIPILVHLLLKSRKVRMKFSTLLFFQQQDPRSTQRRKLRNYLLMMLRLLIVALLALGFARPFLAGPNAANPDQPRRQVILVVDRSASMGAVEREGPRWTRAVQAMRKVLAGLRAGDVAALISCASRAETLAGPATPEEVLLKLKDLQPTAGDSDLGQGLELAGKLMAGGGSGYSNVLYVVTDLQRYSCRNVGSHPVPRQAEIHVLNFGDLFPVNLAVTGLRLDAQGTNRPGAVIANFSDEKSPPIKMRFLVDGKEEAQATLQLPAGGATNFDLAMPRLTNGWHSGEVRLQAGDVLALDNARQATLFVPPPVRVLVAEPRPGTPVFREESFFVVSALDPDFGTTNARGVLFQVDKTTPDRLAEKLAAREGKPPYAVTIIPGMKQVPSGLGTSLAEYVRRGGGLLMFLGDEVSLNRYLTELGELLPGQPAAFETAADYDWRLWESDARSVVFAAFRRPNSGNLMLAKFTRRASWRGYEEKSVLARFQDGVPLLLERQLGQGRILWMNSSANTSWNDWPKHRTYVPFLHSAVRYLRGQDIDAATNVVTALVAGMDADMDLGPGCKKAQLKLLPPTGPEMSIRTDDLGIWRDCALSDPGIYSVRGPQGQELRRLAVNPSPAESDLAAISPLEFEQRLIRLEPSAASSLAAALFGGAQGRQELWRLCLLSVLALLFLELTLANRTIA